MQCLYDGFADLATWTEYQVDAPEKRSRRSKHYKPHVGYIPTAGADSDVEVNASILRERRSKTELRNGLEKEALYPPMRPSWALARLPYYAFGLVVSQYYTRIPWPAALPSVDQSMRSSLESLGILVTLLPQRYPLANSAVTLSHGSYPFAQSSSSLLRPR